MKLPELITETFTSKLSYEANEVKSIDLPTRGYVTRYECLLKLNVSTGTGGGTPNEDAIFRLIKALRIEYPGGRVYYGVPDGRLIKYKNVLDFKGLLREDDLPTAASVTQDVYAKFILNWGFEPLDPFDPTVVIPAEELSDLKMSVLWGSDSDLGDGYTINSGEIEITARYISPTEPIEQIFPLGYNIPVWTPVELDIDAVKSELGLRDDLPVGNVLRETLILVLDSSDNRSNSDVSEVGIVKPKERKTPFRASWLAFNTATRHDYGLPSEITGLGCLDYEDISGIPAGLDLSIEEIGTWKIGFTTTTTGGKIKMAHIQVI